MRLSHAKSRPNCPTQFTFEAFFHFSCGCLCAMVKTQSEHRISFLRALPLDINIPLAPKMLLRVDPYQKSKVFAHFCSRRLSDFHKIVSWTYGHRKERNESRFIQRDCCGSMFDNVSPFPRPGSNKTELSAVQQIYRNSLRFWWQFFQCSLSFVRRSSENRWTIKALTFVKRKQVLFEAQQFRDNTKRVCEYKTCRL